MFHKWIALTDLSDKNYAGTCGFLRLSISVLGPGDEPVSLELDEESSENIDILMPPILDHKP